MDCLSVSISTIGTRKFRTPSDFGDFGDTFLTDNFPNVDEDCGFLIFCMPTTALSLAKSITVYIIINDNTISYTHNGAGNCDILSCSSKHRILWSYDIGFIFNRFFASISPISPIHNY